MRRTEIREKIKAQIKEIEKSLYNMPEVIKIFCLSKAADLTILMLGEQGIAKSSLARDWSTTTGLDFRIITSSEVDESLLAYIDPAIFREKNIVQMKRGELMLRDHILIDEFFLWSNKFRAKLHQLLEERTYAGLSVLTKTYTFASNPITEYFSGQVEDRNLATEDRIDLLLPMYQPKVVATQKMIKKFSKSGRKEIELSKVLDWKDYLKAREEIVKVKIPSDLLVWVTLLAESMSACKYTKSKFDVSRAKMNLLCQECNQKEHLCSRVALSKPRFLRATILLSKALAWFEGREEIIDEDLFSSIKYTLPHRLVFLKEEKTIFEAEREIPELIQEFIDDFNNWEARKIFQKLEKIILKGKDPEEPFFDQESANALLDEVSENLAISNYTTEAIERVKEAVKRKYREDLMKSKKTVKEMKEVLARSGLDIYSKGEILEELISNNTNLTFLYKLDRRDPDSLSRIVEALKTLHREKSIRIESKKLLLKHFMREVSFDSKLITLKEERGKIRISAYSPEVKKRFEELIKKVKESGS